MADMDPERGYSAAGWARRLPAPAAPLLLRPPTAAAPGPAAHAGVREGAPESGGGCLSASGHTLLAEKRWTPPLGRVARIAVAFTDLDGTPYDFQNQDHRLELLMDVGQRAWID